MSDKMTFLLFGDQSLDTHAFLADFCRRGHPSLLCKHFLNQAGAALKDEIDQLSAPERQKIPRFFTVQELNKRHFESGRRNPAIDSALLVITQLAQYIDHAEKVPEDVARPNDTCAVGLCTGLFAAAAVASASSLSMLIPLATQVVLMAFRTGAYVAALGARVHHTGESSECWTYVVPGMNESSSQLAIDQFNLSLGISKTNVAYISAVTASSIAVSGPPSTLEALFAGDTFDAKPLPLPVHGPYHARHLHSGVDLTTLLHLDDSSVSRLLESSPQRCSVISCSTGLPYSEPNTRSLFLAIVRDILMEPLDFHRVQNGCLSVAQTFGGPTCLVMPFGPTHAANSLAGMLQSGTDLNVIIKVEAFSKDVDTSSRAGDHGSSRPCKLAIVGMAGRFPDAATHEKLWELLEKGLDVHREVPKDRFDASTHVDPSGKGTNKSHTPYGCWIENPGLFDPRFFNMSPREAYQTDPMQRMALSTCYEALEMSGYVPNRTRSTQLDRIGTFYGQTSDDWREINAAQDVDTYFITGGVRAFGPGRINYHFGFSGPSFSIDTACSSSMAAMHLACTSLWAGECDTAIVGGMSCMTNSDIFSGLSKGQFLSKKGPCATFDNDADGYCRADGVGTVIVKRLEDAQADNDNILGVILGAATNHSAEAISITHPHGGTQEILYKSILDMSGVDPLDVDYVEMHGTGTQAGDGTEMRSVTNVFAPADRKRDSHQPLYLGAVKANIGHGEAASGVTALIKCLLMLQKNAIPPHVGIKNAINTTFPTDLSERNVNIAFHKTPLKGRHGQPRRIFVNNFSAAGGNSGLLIEDAPTRTIVHPDSRSTHVLAISGRSKSAMLRNVERLISYIEENPTIAVPDLSYTTTARRIQHNWRVALPIVDISRAKYDLTSKLEDKCVPIPQEAPEVAFLFTGQGSHYASLGKELFETSSIFRDSIREFDSIGRIHGFPSFIPLIDGSVTDVEAMCPIIVQLGLVCFEMAMVRVWASWGIKPSVVLGHSLGEYAALNASGVLSASDTIYLVGVRAQCLVEKCTPGTHAMLAIQGSVPAVMQSLEKGFNGLSIACINGPRETVISGETAEISSAAEELLAAGFKTTQLKVPFAFHSAQVDSILDDFEKLAQAVRFENPLVPLVSSILGRPFNTEEKVDPAYLCRQARDPVDFLGALTSSQETGLVNGKTIWLEVGPHPVCSGMVKACFGTTTMVTPTLRRNESAYATIASTLCKLHVEGLDIDWNEYHRDFVHCLRLLDIPSYSFDDKNYWLQYTGDWCLTKGRISGNGAGLLEDAKPKLYTSTVHRVVSESVSADVATVSIESDLAVPELKQAIMGHLVNGAALCPSSIYADMAMTVCDYAYKLLRPKAEKVAMNVAHMEVTKPLIAKPDGKIGEQVLTLTATVDSKISQANLVFSSGKDKSLIQHASCKVLFGDSTSWLAEWKRNAYLIQSRIDHLQDAEKSGKASKIGRGLVYKLFTALVNYDARYRGMEEVILGADMEATSRVVFQTTEQDGKFFCSPYWIDSVAHISGFIVNGSDAVDSNKQVYVSHGWETLRIAESFSLEKTYRSYVKMQPAGDKMVAGDVYVFDGDRIIAVVGGLKFQCIPRTLMNTFLPPIGASAPAKRATSTQVASQVKAVKAAQTAQISLSNLQSINKKLVSLCSQALDILSKEIGVSTDELVDNIAFADLGVDSLMALTVSGRMREELEIDIPSSTFIEYPTIGEFKKVVNGFEMESSISSSSSVGPFEESTPELEDSSPISTPADDSSSDVDREDSLGDLIRATIAEEMGVDMEEITENIDLNSLGMDSLMSLTILGSLREKTGLSLPADLFISNSSIGQIEKSLHVQRTPKAVVSVIAKPSLVSSCGPNRQATSVLLQGNARTAERYLWFVPDGSGSATSYVDIPNLLPNLAVWGLNSPFMKTPEEFVCGVVGIAEKYIVEMKRRQPQGPYLLSGWSAGGVIAFECVVQLLRAGDVVDSLIILDAPCPLTIEPLPQSLHRWFASIGLLGDGDASKLPPWLLPHFASSVTALSTYTATDIDAARCPKVTAIWCEDGVCKYPSDPKPDPYPYGHAQWLLENRTDFGPNLWDTYIDPSKMVMKHMPGNHFSMMKAPEVDLLGDLIREAIERV
ncbi:MAG: hypothetical protein M1818_006981 [Claussenomyces sp. TS43310]|nr:MAG: hypothetical protein M1818_006981 [Claussenomyces sp. TS43310]